MAKKDKSKKSKKSDSGESLEIKPAGLISAVIIVLLLIAGIGFLVFGLIQSTSGGDTAGGDTEVASEDNGNEDTEDTGDAQEINSEEEDGSDTAAESDADNDTNSTEPGEDSDETNGNNDVEGDRLNTERYPSTSTTVSEVRGNDYEFGDITGSTHTVEAGDTLWQIAEGRYGSGFAWVEINQANSGFPLLPDGTPVNIPVGYELELPDLRSE